MRIALLSPPLTDPTTPYHSTAYLKGHLLRNGFSDVVLRDLNAEFMAYCLTPCVVEAFYREGERRVSRLETRSQIGFSEEQEYVGLWSHSRALSPEKIADAAAGLKCMDRFLDYPAYQRNVRVLKQYLRFLGALSYPAELHGFHQYGLSRFSINNLGDLLSPELAERVCYPFIRFYSERLSADPDIASADCVGVSIPYNDQLTYGLWLARALKAAWPGKLVVLGGTAISQCFKYLSDKERMAAFFRDADAIVVGEGETAMCEIAASAGNPEKLRAAPNTITFDRSNGRVHFPDRIHHENIASLGAPVYSYDWDLYLAPERAVNYAPTRGCYWNRCAFCDYGLSSDSPTSPWRERPVELVVEDLLAAKRSQSVKYVYFAVDVMSPKYVRNLAGAITRARLDIRWSAELRLEKSFNGETCSALAESGAVCVSVGMESGSQRVLDLMSKGTRLEDMAGTIQAFAKAGIAVQLMAFQGFPGELPEDKRQTLDLAARLRPYWATGGLGHFMLTAGAHIAKTPGKFGVRLTERKGADILAWLSYCTGDQVAPAESALEQFEPAAEDFDGLFPLTLGRPLAGGTDSLHSMIYYEHFGPNFFKDHPLETAPTVEDCPSNELLDCAIELRGILRQSAFDIPAILANRKKRLQQARHLLATGIEPTYTEFLAWAATIPPLLPGRACWWLSNSRRCVKLDQTLFAVIREAVDTGARIRDVLPPGGADFRMRLIASLAQLKKSGLIAPVSQPLACAATAL